MSEPQPHIHGHYSDQISRSARETERLKIKKVKKRTETEAKLFKSKKNKNTAVT